MAIRNIFGSLSGQICNDGDLWSFNLQINCILLLFAGIIIVIVNFAVATLTFLLKVLDMIVIK